MENTEKKQEETPATEIKRVSSSNVLMANPDNITTGETFNPNQIDELFNESMKEKNNKSFVQLISVKTASPAGFKTVNPGPIDVTEYILFYVKK